MSVCVCVCVGVCGNFVGKQAGALVNLISVFLGGCGKMTCV